MTIAVLTFSKASAQDIETLVMPGQVITGHADVEEECSSCHRLFDKVGQRKLCMDCHEDVAADIDASIGYHGLQSDASNDQCSTCHTDHEGRDANIVNLDEDDFDHSFTDFELLGAHLENECADCHAPDEKFRDLSSECVDCHREDDGHKETMGTDCGSCHQSTEWPDAEFDHDTTDFRLIGKHQETACLDCHEDLTFLNAPTTCFGCHEEDDSHNGRSGNECENCHNPKDWSDTSFDHTRDTNFERLGKHAELSCGDCHSETPFEDEMDMACLSCHLEEDEHDGHRGVECDSCHGNDSWPEVVFDHDRDTDYRLLGGHREITCIDCHVEPIFEVELKTSCDSCHADDDAHEGTLGSQCENCHTEVNWQDPVFFDHDLSRFPLLGKHGEPECDACHATQAFTEVEVDCVSCHRDDDSHRGNFGDRCDACHNPVSWDAWTFDHDTQTDFSLTNAHVNVACNDCHRSSLDKIKKIDGSCRSCHRADDIHDGEFGPNCGRCHTSDSFSEVRSIQ